MIFHAQGRRPLPCSGVSERARQNGLVRRALFAHDIGHHALAVHVDAWRRTPDDLDPLHAGGGNALQDALQIVGLGGGPGPVHQHIAGRAGKAPGGIAGIQRKSGQPVHHVIGGGGARIREETGRIDRNPLLGLGQGRARQKPNHENYCLFSCHPYVPCIAV